MTKLQYFGYFVALIGVTGYSAYKRAQQQEAAAKPKELELPVAGTRGKGTPEELQGALAMTTDEDDEEAK